jgi:uncharacterized protein
MHNRYLCDAIEQDAFPSQKMALVSGPRQVGKTTFSKSMLTCAQNYFTWDDPTFRRAWLKSPRSALQGIRNGPTVLDEVHKDRRWKNHLKGYFDTVGPGDGLLVTGSARLDLYRRGGDSMLGRYLPYRLHPFSVGEREVSPSPDALEPRTPRIAWRDLVALGGFPEPLMGGSTAKATRWSRLRLERLVQEDVRDIRGIADLSGLRVLADMLPERVGSLLSVNSLREDLGVAHATLKSWLEVFEALYVCFSIRPYATRLARAVAKAPKVYLFDPLPIESHHARLENLAALHLLKACEFWTDTAQGLFELRYLRNKDQREVDFLVLRDKKPWYLIDCKGADTQVGGDLLRYQTLLHVPHVVQLVEAKGHDRVQQGVRVVDYERFFSAWV